MGHSQAPLPPGQQSLSPHLPPAEMLLTCSEALPEATASGQRALPPPGPVGTVLVSSILPGLGPAVILVLLPEQPSAPSHQLPGRARPCAEGVPRVLSESSTPLRAASITMPLSLRLRKVRQPAEVTQPGSGSPRKAPRPPDTKSVAPECHQMSLSRALRGLARAGWRTFQAPSLSWAGTWPPQPQFSHLLSGTRHCYSTTGHHRSLLDQGKWPQKKRPACAAPDPRTLTLDGSRDSLGLSFLSAK